MLERPTEKAANFSVLLADKRTRAGLSRQALAQQAGLDASHLYRLETGGRGTTRETLLALAQALGVSGPELAIWLRAAGLAPVPTSELPEPDGATVALSHRSRRAQMSLS